MVHYTTFYNPSPLSWNSTVDICFAQMTGIMCCLLLIIFESALEKKKGQDKTSLKQVVVLSKQFHTRDESLYIIHLFRERLSEKEAKVRATIPKIKEF